MAKIVKIHWQYEGITGIAYDKFLASCSMEGLLFWYEEGNGACDCNRSRIIGFNDMPCGDKIKFTMIEVIENGKQA